MRGLLFSIGVSFVSVMLLLKLMETWWLRADASGAQKSATARCLLYLEGRVGDHIACEAAVPLKAYLLQFQPVRWFMRRVYRGRFPGMIDLVHVRTRFIDGIIETLPRGKYTQLVVLGAGYDSRFHRFHHKMSWATFEVDERSNSLRKTEFIAKAGIETFNTKFVHVDFEAESLFDRLLVAGYDPKQPTLFLLEGTTVFLEPSALLDLFRQLHANSSPSSAIIFDYWGDVKPLQKYSYLFEHMKLRGEPLVGFAARVPKVLTEVGWETTRKAKANDHLPAFIHIQMVEKA